MNSVLRQIERGANVIGALMFLSIFLLFMLQIIARYVFRWPIGWPDEAIAFLFVWVCFWGGALMMPVERHITFDLLHDALPRRLGWWTRIITLSLTAGLFLAALPITADFILFSHRQMTPVIELPLSAVYAPIFLFLLVVSLRILAVLWTELRTSREERA